MGYELVPKEEITNRIQRFRELLAENGIDVAVIVQSADLFYFTGIVQQGILLVFADDEPIFFVRKSFDRARRETPLSRVEEISSPSDIPSRIGNESTSGRVVGFEMDVIPAWLLGRLSEILSPSSVMDITHLIRTARAVKSEYEIRKMKESGKRLVSLVEKAKEVIREGVSEVEVAGRIVDFALSNGHGGIIKMRNWNQDLTVAHVLSGENGSVETFTDTPLGGKGLHTGFPFGPSERRIERGEPVIVDVMWVHEGYTTDMTRVFSVGGIKDEKLLEAHDLAIEIIRSIEKMLVPGSGTRLIYEEAVSLAEKNGFSEYFMGYGKNRVKFVGHGIGIEVDEYPFFAEKLDFLLEEGMTVAIEPKFVFPGKGAVGVENTYLITREGPENLTKLDEKIIIL